MRGSIHSYFYLFTIGLFLSIAGANIFSDGMFVDGVVYANISRNMAEGMGSFWKPHLSTYLYHEFYEHPPLALGIQSIFFKIFGDSIYVERFYSLGTFLVTGYLIVLIWKQFTGILKTAWLPLLAWVLISTVTWSVANNMLENTMSIFICFSVLLILKGQNQHNFLFLFLAGLSLSLGFLSKGFFCLYLWALPFYYYIINGKGSFRSMLFQTTLFIGFTALPLICLYLFVPEAKHNLISYINTQVLESIQNRQTVNSRFQIVYSFLQNISLPSILALVVLVLSLKTKEDKKLYKQNLKQSLTLLALALSGVLPITISMKQSDFYILSVYPFFALALAYYMLPIVFKYSMKLNLSSKALSAFKLFSLSLFVGSIVLCIAQKNRVGRNEKMISEVKEIVAVVGQKSTVNMCSSMYYDWSLQAYFMRYAKVNLSNHKSDKHDYFISENNCDQEYLSKNYKALNLNTKLYKLHKRLDL